MPDDAAADLPESFQRAETVSDAFEQVLVLNAALADAQGDRAGAGDRADQADHAAALAGTDLEPGLRWLTDDADGLFERVKRVIEQLEANMAALASTGDVQSYTISVGMSVGGPSVNLSVTYSDPAGAADEENADETGGTVANDTGGGGA